MKAPEITQNQIFISITTMKYLFAAIIIFILLVIFSKSLGYAPVQSDSQYPVSELIAQDHPRSKFLSDALQSSLCNN